MEFTDLIRIAAITVLLSLLWAGSIAFTYWDLHRAASTGSKNTLWLFLVVVFPLVGFAIYLFARILRALRPSGPAEAPLRPRRQTALKRPVAQRGPTSTILATDVAADTMLNREDVAPVSERQKSPLKYIFTITSGSDAGKEFTVASFPVYIGRDSESLILLSGDLGISRKHAEIYERDGAIRIRDLKSTHGTQVNGQRIDDKNLVSGDRIQVGRTVLVVKADGG